MANKIHSKINANRYDNNILPVVLIAILVFSILAVSSALLTGNAVSTKTQLTSSSRSVLSPNLIKNTYVISGTDTIDARQLDMVLIRFNKTISQIEKRINNIEGQLADSSASYSSTSQSSGSSSSSTADTSEEHGKK